MIGEYSFWGRVAERLTSARGLLLALLCLLIGGWGVANMACSSDDDDESWPPPLVNVISIDRLEAPEEISTADSSFSIALISDTDVACDEIVYDASRVGNELDLTVKGYIYPDTKNSYPTCNDEVVPFGRRQYRIEAPPPFLPGHFEVRVRQPEGYDGGHLRATVPVTSSAEQRREWQRQDQ